MEKKMYDLIVDEELERVAPPLTEDELEILQEDILEHGCKFPLIVWGDTIVDGHNRYRICKEEGIPFAVEQMEFADKTEAKLWIIRNQLGRRNLHPFQRCEMVAPMEEAIRADAEKRRREKISATRKAGETVPKVAPSLKTRDVMAKMAGVSHTTYCRAKVIIEKADEKTKERLRTEELKIGNVFNNLMRAEKAAKEEKREDPGKTGQEAEETAAPDEARETEEPSGFDDIREQLDYAFDTFLSDLNYALEWLSGETATKENEAKIMDMIDEVTNKARTAVSKKMEEVK